MKRKNKKLSSFNINISVLMFMFATGANAEKITFEFKGVITSVDEELNRHRGGGQFYVPRPKNGYAPGDMFSGTYTFETTTRAPFHHYEHTFSGAISTMSFASSTNTVKAANGGDVRVRASSWYRLYNAEFSQISGGRIDKAVYVPQHDDPSHPKYDPIFDAEEMTLTWPMSMAAGTVTPDISDVGHAPIFFDENANLPSVSHFHSDVEIYDQDDYTLDAPNYADFNLTYKSIKTSKKALVKGKIFSVKPVPNPVSATQLVPIAIDWGKLAKIPVIEVPLERVTCPRC